MEKESENVEEGKKLLKVEHYHLDITTTMYNIHMQGVGVGFGFFLVF